MKSYVTDANVVFSALISGKESYLMMLAESNFLFPDFGLNEIQEYQAMILKKSKLPLDDLKVFTLQLFSSITVVPNFLISKKSYFEAFQLCKDIDEKDVAYLALAIEFDLELLTKDEVLVVGLRQKGFQKIISLKEFLTKVDEK